MALKGNLRDFSFTQLLNLINLARKTGMLVVESSTGVARVIFNEGKLAFAQFAQDDASLPGVLQRSNRITPSQYRILKEKAANMSDKELGLMLINAGYVSRDEILNSLQVYVTGVVRKLFTWVDGIFHFEQDAISVDGKILVKVDLENLIIEGARQQRELEHLQEEIPSLDMALKFTDRPGTNLRNINLSVEEWRVVSFVNPKNSIHQIARATKLNDNEIRKVVYGLLQAGLVELVRSASAPPPPVPRQFPTQNKDEQKSLVNRLINRIRSI